MFDIIKFKKSWDKIKNISEDKNISKEEWPEFLKSLADMIDNLVDLLKPFLKPELERIICGFSYALKMIAEGIGK